MKPADVNSNTYFVFNEENNKKDSKLEVGYMYEYQNIKIFLKKVMFQIVLKKLL